MERWHGCRVIPTEMMSNSTLPLGFLHSNTELVTCGQLLYFPILGQRKLSRVFHSGRSNEIHLFDQFTANLHFVVRVNYKFRLENDITPILDSLYENIDQIVDTYK